jgi:hypothetical protein
MRSKWKLHGLVAVLGLAVAVPAAQATFVGDLVFCDVDRDGVFSPPAGDYPLSGVRVGIECRTAENQVCFGASTVTGTIHDSAAPYVGTLLQSLCGNVITWDPGVSTAGRYLVEVFDSCVGAGPGPWMCRVTVDQGTAPADCNEISTPLAAGPPVDGNNDGDFCDPEDGPFPEGQTLGNQADSSFTCNQRPDPGPGTGFFTVIVEPVGDDDCALYNDFGFAPRRHLQGCTPGYWKQKQHFDSWVGYAPGDSFEAVFGRDVPGNPTLLAALKLTGGGLKALMRHAVAALLSAAHPDINYTFGTPADVIAAFQAAFDSGVYEPTKDAFDEANNAGCPLD